MHGFGDITLTKSEAAARAAIKTLRMEDVLATDPRICFTIKGLRIALEIVARLMAEISAQDQTT